MKHFIFSYISVYRLLWLAFKQIFKQILKHNWGVFNSGARFSLPGATAVMRPGFSRGARHRVVVPVRSDAELLAAAALVREVNWGYQA